ncbi:MAG: primosomal protein N' [Planctomycetia bacterium]|nr:MAG: primosomal protein N' [Planctomycetia bacterium]
MSQDSRQLWLLPSEGRPVIGPIADVAVKSRSFSLRPVAVPEALRADVSPGAIVAIPRRAGRGELTGVCVRVSEGEWTHSLPRMIRVIQPGPLLTPGLAALGVQVSAHYACPIGRVFFTLIPAAARKGRRERRVLMRAGNAPPDGARVSAGQRRVLEVLGAAPITRDELLRSAAVSAATLRLMAQRGWIAQEERFSVRREYSTATGADSRSPAPESGGCAPVAADGDCASAAATNSTTATAGPLSPEDAFALNGGQTAALSALADDFDRAAGFRVNLLFGVPGSGKTEVYVRAIREVIRRGRQAILLVPEIMLATQIVERLARRFDRTAVLHSRMTPTARLDSLRRIAAGDADVVIGTRTAVFAPLPHPGLIVVDEEQEPSYKNLAAPFYHARDAAILRARIEGIPVVLGSATPALETWHNATHLPHYRLLRLPERVPGARLPEVRLLKSPGGADAGADDRPVMSRELVALVQSAVAAGEQVILLHNRRGFSTMLRCVRCGIRVACERCGRPMVLHRARAVVKCHRCGVQTAAPRTCADQTCGGTLSPGGSGIQRLEEELTAALPTARLMRLDRDTLLHRRDYAAALQRFERREADVLIGTQLIAKGLDFPGVRLVGVIDADAALRLPDFRAAERVFQLMVQVVGRAGRKEGESLAVLQAADPGQAALRCAAELDYEGFAAAELALRERYFQPPFSRLARLVLADERPGRARESAATLSKELRSFAPRVHPLLRVDDPAPCPVRRLRGQLRWHVMIRGPRGGEVGRLLELAHNEHRLSPPVRRLTVDVDPMELL